jgi:hypothetical protein
MDDPKPRVGRGVPFTFTNLTQRDDEIDLGITWGQKTQGDVVPGIPRAAQRFTAHDIHASQDIQEHR